MILLAFVAQKLVTSSSQPAEQPTFTGFQKELTEGKVSRVTMQTKNQELEVTLKDGKTYVTGYPDNYGAEVTTAIDEAKVPFVVEGKGVRCRPPPPRGARLMPPGPCTAFTLTPLAAAGAAAGTAAGRAARPFSMPALRRSTVSDWPALML